MQNHVIFFAEALRQAASIARLELMNFKSFSSSIWTQIEAALVAEKKIRANPVAAFDADGTLWATDLGEAYFKYQISKNLLPDVFKNYPDPWRHYRDWKESGDPRPAYLWLAQIHQGHPLSKVRDWAEENVRAMEPLPIFPEQKKLIRYFLDQGVSVYVVTASVAWAVEPGAARLGVPQHQVLGVRTSTPGDIVTSTQDGPITYREGKLKALLEATGGVSPFFASGNTMGDFSLLEGAGLKLAVCSTSPQEELFQAEQDLQTKAADLQRINPLWMSHKF